MLSSSCHRLNRQCHCQIKQESVVVDSVVLYSLKGIHAWMNHRWTFRLYSDVQRTADIKGSGPGVFFRRNLVHFETNQI